MKFLSAPTAALGVKALTGAVAAVLLAAGGAAAVTPEVTAHHHGNRGHDSRGHHRHTRRGGHRWIHHRHTSHHIGFWHPLQQRSMR